MLAKPRDNKGVREGCSGLEKIQMDVQLSTLVRCFAAWAFFESDSK
jgi:hypothetical protein